MGTDLHVRATIGPNPYWKNGDIIVVFKPEILQHPDFDTTLVSGTSVFSNSAKAAYEWLRYEQGAIEVTRGTFKCHSST